MTKRVSTLILSAAMLAAPALAQSAAQPIAFERDGIHYVGTIADRADGAQLIEGHEVESGHAFALTVQNGRVSGTYDQQFVNYAAPRTKPARAIATGGAAPATGTGL